MNYKLSKKSMANFLFNQKCTLYHTLISIESDELTPDDIELMYRLSQDTEVQEYLSQALKSKKQSSKM